MKPLFSSLAAHPEKKAHQPLSLLQRFQNGIHKAKKGGSGTVRSEKEGKRGVRCFSTITLRLPRRTRADASAGSWLGTALCSSDSSAAQTGGKQKGKRGRKKSASGGKVLAFLLVGALLLYPGGVAASDGAGDEPNPIRSTGSADGGEGEPDQATSGQLAAEQSQPQQTAGGPQIEAKSGLLLDFTTGTVLYDKNCHDKMPPASITKIMTMLLVMEAIESGNLTMQDMVTATAHASSMGGTQIWLKEGEQMSVHDLMKATAVASANDAAMALAEHVGGSEEGFVAMMNHKAAELGMLDTTFCNPTGLDADGHVSSAYDIALMSRELLRHPQIKEFTSIWMDSLRDGKTELVNTNKLVRFYKGCTGLKTGTTDGAGSCVSVSATREDMSLISVVMGCTTSKARFDSAKRLLDYGFGMFAMYQTGVSSDSLAPVRVNGGVENAVEVETDSGGMIIIQKGKEKAVTEDVNIVPEVEAPVEAGQVLGDIRLSIDGKQIATFQVRAKQSVEKMTFLKCFTILFQRLVTL